MTAVATEPKQLSPINDLVGQLQAMQEPLLEQVRVIRHDDRKSASAKAEDIQALIGGNDSLMEMKIEDAQHEANVLLSSAQESLRFERGKLNERIAGVNSDDLGTVKEAKLATIETQRARLAIENEQLLRSIGNDDSEFARWSMGVIEQAKNGEVDGRLSLDWLARIGLRLAKGQSAEPSKYMTTSQLITDAHDEVFDSSKVRQAEAKIQAAREKLDGVRGVKMNYLRKIQEGRNLRIKGVR